MIIRARISWSPYSSVVARAARPGRERSESWVADWPARSLRPPHPGARLRPLGIDEDVEEGADTTRSRADCGIAHHRDLGACVNGVGRETDRVHVGRAGEKGRPGRRGRPEKDGRSVSGDGEVDT